MGRQNTTKTDYAYIAGFLDGDGSIMVQIKKRSDTKQGWRFMFTLCFYQDSGHAEYLKWIQQKLGMGYVSHRKDKMSELRINGYGTVKEILLKLRPYVKFKEKQVQHALEILSAIEGKNFLQTDPKEREKIAQAIVQIRKENYWSHWRKYTEEDIRQIVVNGVLSP